MSGETAISAWFWNRCSGWGHFLPVFTEDLFSEARHFPIWCLDLFLLRSPPVCPVNGSLELYCGLRIASVCGPKAPRGQGSLSYSWISVFHMGSLACDTGPKISLVEWLLRPWGKNTLSFGKCPLTHCIMDLLLSVMKPKIAKAHVFHLHQMGFVEWDRVGR